MRDRLSELLTTKPALEENLDSAGAEELLDQQAAMFEGQDVMNGVQKEAQNLRKELLLLKLNVKRLAKQNARFLTSVRRISSIKRDSSALGRDIKAKGEAAYGRLERLRGRGQELEEEHGASSAVARMARLQHAALSADFHQTMTRYHEAELVQRENCKTRIQRQAEVVGLQLSRDQIQQLTETGWNAFSENLLLERRGARSALSQIHQRHQELLDLETRIREVQDLFSHMFLLVEEQGCRLDRVEDNVQNTEDYVSKAGLEIRRAEKFRKDNVCRKLLCCCCCCQ